VIGCDDSSRFIYLFIYFYFASFKFCQYLLLFSAWLLRECGKIFELGILVMGLSLEAWLLFASSSVLLCWAASKSGF
jgi:hypothetical protein